MKNNRIRCSVSEFALLVLGEMEEDDPFVVKHIKREHPSVDEHILDAIDEVSRKRSDRCLQVYWELQADMVYRWHVMIHRTLSRTDDPVPYYLVQKYASTDPLRSAPYMPLDWRVVKHLKDHYLRSNEALLAGLRLREKIKEIKSKAQAIDDAEQEAKWIRRLHDRMWKWNTADPGWSPGVTKAGEKYETSKGPLGRDVTQAVSLAGGK